MNILLIHQYAGNKGDRAVLNTTCRLLHDITPDARIWVSTSSPELWEEEKPFYNSLNVSFIPSAWDYTRTTSLLMKVLNKFRKYTFTLLRESFLMGLRNIPRILLNPEFRQCASSADLICSVGGHHFTTLLSRDLVSSINFDAAAACLYSAPKIALPQSFGAFEFHNPRNKKFTISILRQFKKLCVRESSSNEALEQLGITSEIIENVPETVLALNYLCKDYIEPKRRNQTVGIAVYATVKRSFSERNEYTRIIADFASYLINKGYRVRFFPMEIKGTEPDDRPMIHEICNQISGDKYDVLEEDLPADKHFAEVSKCRAFIGHKTHSAIFALASGTPLLAIAYHPKTTEFLAQFNRVCDSVTDVGLKLESLITKFDELEKNIDEIGTSHHRMSQSFAESIKESMMNICKNI